MKLGPVRDLDELFAGYTELLMRVRDEPVRTIPLDRALDDPLLNLLDLLLTQPDFLGRHGRVLKVTTSSISTPSRISSMVIPRQRQTL